jgi:hypothetical protein
VLVSTRYGDAEGAAVEGAQILFGFHPEGSGSVAKDRFHQDAETASAIVPATGEALAVLRTDYLYDFTTTLLSKINLKCERVGNLEGGGR